MKHKLQRSIHIYLRQRLPKGLVVTPRAEPSEGSVRQCVGATTVRQLDLSLARVGDGRLVSRSIVSPTSVNRGICQEKRCWASSASPFPTLPKRSPSTIFASGKLASIQRLIIGTAVEPPVVKTLPI
jgi:hypothetical protein